MLLCQISDAGPKASEQLTATMAKMHEPQEEHGKTGTFVQEQRQALPCIPQEYFATIISQKLVPLPQTKQQF